MTERAPGTDPSAALDLGGDGRAPAPAAVRVSLVGANPGAARARLVVGPAPEPGHAMIDGRSIAASLRRLDDIHARLEASAGPESSAGPDAMGPEADGRGSAEDTSPGHGATAAILLLPPRAAGPRSGTIRREVIVDGWRFEVDVEPEARAALRERASRAAAAQVQDGPSEVRAVIPGRIVSVEVVPGDSVVAGQRVMIIEAMKMQNELRVPRDGTVGRIVVGAGQTIEVGDLLLVLE